MGLQRQSHLPKDGLHPSIIQQRLVPEPGQLEVRQHGIPLDEGLLEARRGSIQIPKSGMCVCKDAFSPARSSFQ